MRKTLTVMAILAVIVLVSGCSGVSSTGRTFSAQAMCLNVLTIQIPGDPLQMATDRVPPAASIQNVTVNPQDLDSVQGWLYRLFSIGYCQIGGTIQPGMAMAKE